MNTRMRMGAVGVTALLVLSGGLNACGSDAADDGDYSVGSSVASMGNDYIRALANGTERALEEDGASVETADGKLDPATSVSQIKRFIAEGKDYLALASVMVPNSLKAVIADAKKEDIRVFASEWSFNESDPTAAPADGVDGQVNIDRLAEGGDQVAAAREALDGGPIKAIYVGIPFPVLPLDTTYAGIKAALGPEDEIVGKVENQTDNAEGARDPLISALRTHPDVNTIITYNGPSALGAVAALERAGLTGKVNVLSGQVIPSLLGEIKSGRVTAGWDQPPRKIASELAGLIAAAQRGAPKSEWRKTVVIKSVRVTADNVGEWDDWSDLAD